MLAVMHDSGSSKGHISHMDVPGILERCGQNSGSFFPSAMPFLLHFCAFHFRARRDAAWAWLLFTKNGS